MAYTLVSRSDPFEVWKCDGLCIDPSRTMTEIFTLLGAYCMTGTALGDSGDAQATYLKEVARSISVIALNCRQQITSYFNLYGPNLSTEQKIEKLKTEYPSANSAIGALVGVLDCKKKKKLIQLNFYDLIGKLCHVEQWQYPVPFAYELEDEQQEQPNLPDLRALEIIVTQRGKQPVSGETERCLVSLPDFIDAARVFITGCTVCQLTQVTTHDECET